MTDKIRALILFSVLGLGAGTVVAGSRNIPPVNETEDQNRLRIGLRRISENVLPSAGGDNLFFRDVQNNRVGVGTTTPSCTLDVSGTLCGTSLTATTISASTITVTYTISGGTLLAPYPVAIFRDEKASGTEGGSFTSGSWQTRVLNTTSTNTISGASLSSNQITLPTGTYYVKFKAPAYACARHQTRLVSVSGASVSIVGQTGFTNLPGGSDSADSVSSGDGVFTVPASSSTVIELQHQCATTRLTNGLGLGASFGVNNVFGVVEIWRTK